MQREVASIDVGRLVSNLKQRFQKDSRRFFLPLSCFFNGDYSATSITVKYKTLSQALTVAYPEHPWILARFKNLPKKILREKNHVKDILEFWMKKLNLKEMDDWYNVSRKQIDELGGIFALDVFQEFSKFFI